MNDDLRLSEYGTLRATIRERGTVRVCAILTVAIAWGALTIALAAWQLDRALSLVPLAVLGVGFEINFFLHTGVERIGRYLQVFYEDASAANGSGWENVVMAYGKNYPGGGADPLFVTPFTILVMLDFFTSFVAAYTHPGWLLISFPAHAAVLWRLFGARSAAAGQRALDLERFRALKNSQPSN